LLITNHPAQAPGNDPALRARLFVIPLDQSFLRWEDRNVEDRPVGRHRRVRQVQCAVRLFAGCGLRSARSTAGARRRDENRWLRTPPPRLVLDAHLPSSMPVWPNSLRLNAVHACWPLCWPRPPTAKSPLQLTHTSGTHSAPAAFRGHDRPKPNQFIGRQSPASRAKCERLTMTGTHRRGTPCRWLRAPDRLVV